MVDVILGLQWGDEGKGKIVDFFAPKYDLIARFQGGPNAGHTLYVKDKKIVLHQIPSGIFHENTANLIGNGVVLDPVTLKRECGSVAAFGVDYQVSGRFGDCLDRLKVRLADPVGDRVCESLRVARDVGGGDLGRLLRYLSGTFLLTLSNPSTILSFVAVFGALAGRAPAASASPWAMVSGVLVGSALWWLLLSTGVGLLRERFDARWQRAINLCSAAMLGGLALWQLVQLVR